MIIINRKKKVEQYKLEQMPQFSHKMSAMIWYHVQKMNAELINIKSIDVQVKDIKKMIYSYRPSLVSFYARFNLLGEYSDDDYINISKYKKGNKHLIYEILNANWLLKLGNLEDKTEEELEYEIFCLQNKVDEMKKKINSNGYYYGHNIKLLEYKLSCLEDYMFQRVNKQQVNQILVKKLPILLNAKK